MLSIGITSGFPLAFGIPFKGRRVTSGFQPRSCDLSRPVIHRNFLSQSWRFHDTRPGKWWFHGDSMGFNGDFMGFQLNRWWYLLIDSFDIYIDRWYWILLTLVGGFNLPIWKIWFRQLGWWHSQYEWKNNPNVPNHRPGILLSPFLFEDVWRCLEIMSSSFWVNDPP